MLILYVVEVEVGRVQATNSEATSRVMVVVVATEEEEEAPVVMEEAVAAIVDIKEEEEEAVVDIKEEVVVDIKEAVVDTEADRVDTEEGAVVVAMTTDKEVDTNRWVPV